MQEISPAWFDEWMMAIMVIKAARLILPMPALVRSNSRSRSSDLRLPT